jgi:hypothetical protein
MSQKKTKRGGEVCVRQPDGSYFDAAIHEEIMAGVDDSDIRATTRLKLLAAGVPAGDLNRVFPDLPPLT